MRQTIKASTTLVLALGLASSLAPEARAERKNPLDGQPSLRHKVEMRKSRLEITPQFVVSMNQDFRHFIGGGLVLQYHITDWFGLAVSVAGGGGLDTGLSSRISDQLKSDPMDPMRPAFQPTKAQYAAHLASTNLLLSVYTTITPFAGKMALFGAAFLRYDTYLMLGLGFQNMTNTWGSFPSEQKTPAATCADPMITTDPNTCDPSNAGFQISGMFGVGVHFYFNHWLGLNVELRDFLNNTNPGGLDVNGDRKVDGHDNSIQNNLYVGIGLTFMLPTTAKISP